MGNKGITLIALVISIIVILILAGVTIATLTGENGILNRVQDTRGVNAEAQADEQAQLAYMGVKTEIIAERVLNASYNATSLENTKTLGEKVKKDLAPNNTTKPWNVDYGTEGTIKMTFEDNSLNNANNATNSHQIVYTIELPGAGETTVTLKKDNVDMARGGSGSSSDSGGDQTGTLTGINWGENKTVSDVQVGDDITIGTDVLNQFRILSKSASQIVAVPHYNITLDTSNPVQTITNDSTTQTIFANSGTKDWTTGTDNIESESTAYLLKPYVEAYSARLNKATGNIGKVSARLGKYSEFNIIKRADGSEVTDELEKKIIRNPGKTGNFWLGSGVFNYSIYVRRVDEDGGIGFGTYYVDQYAYGVRPVVVINLSGGDTGDGYTPGSLIDGKTGVYFGSKTATTVAKGDTISIGEEQFMVLTNNGSTIMAMPYYNITLDTINPMQSSSAGTISFSSSKYWTGTEYNIEPMSSSNIQQYISAYSAKLSTATNEKATAEVGRDRGDYALSSFDRQSNSESKMLLNPSGVGDFWVGTFAPSPLTSRLRFVVADGSLMLCPFGDARGIRPVIFIDIS